MLHALLHHKLDELTPEPQRLEDALTSSVVGTLVMADASTVLLRWFGRAMRVRGFPSGFPDGPIRGVWFWPRLALAEPDVVLRIGDRLFVIEAKYRSGRHDLAAGERSDSAVTDQIQRQWASLDRARAASTDLPHDLHEAIETCKLTMLFVVDGRRRRRAEREFRESATRLPNDADFRLLTWQTLYEIIGRDMTCDMPAYCRAALLEYLEHTGLQGFTGFGRTLGAETVKSQALRDWCARTAQDIAVDLRSAFGCHDPDSLIAMQSWGGWSDPQYSLHGTVEQCEPVYVEACQVWTRKFQDQTRRESL